MTDTITVAGGPGVDSEIRLTARRLLRAQGTAAVTLRAIARELGITAPALYRYFGSRDCLLRALADEICVELAAYVRRAHLAIGTDNPARLGLEPSRALRRWALANPREFELVFSSTSSVAGETAHPARDPLSRLFICLVAQTLHHQGVLSTNIRRAAELPAPLLPDMIAFSETIAATLRTLGDPETAARMSPGLAYLALHWWSRLYGQIALEVLDRYPFPVSHRELLFEQLLRELAVYAGLPLEN